MGGQRDVGGNPSIPPSSFWAQRSAQPAGIYIEILSKCIRIVIVAWRLRSDSCFFFCSSRMGYVGLPPKPA